MQKATAIAPANIAFVKYWGKKDEKLRLPLNSSISMNLSQAYTTTTVEFSDELREDDIVYLKDTKPTHLMHVHKNSGSPVVFNKAETARVVLALDRIRARSGISLRARVMTKNSFPKGVGAAASASGFAALTVAGFAAAGVKLSEKELTIFACLGSGSACRSIPDGLVEWVAGETSETSYAYSLYPPTYWDLRDILLIVSQKEKKVSSTAGMEQVKTSPLWQKRIAAIPKRIAQLKRAFKEQDFESLGEVIEEDCLDMHAVMQSQNPPLFYWNDLTRKLMGAVRAWRSESLPVYFTIDAGPNVHLICEQKTVPDLKKRLEGIKEVQKIIVNHPNRGAHLIDKHLF